MMFNLLVEKAYALSGPTLGFSDLNTAIETLFNVVIWAAGIIFLVLFMVGGIQYLSSAGNEEATKKAKTLLIDAVIGLIIVLAAWAIGSWILTRLGLQPGNL